MKRVNKMVSRLGGFSSGASLGGKVSWYRKKQNIYMQGVVLPSKLDSQGLRF
jgi:hypothetical protein